MQTIIAAKLEIIENEIAFHPLWRALVAILQIEPLTSDLVLRLRPTHPPFHLLLCCVFTFYVSPGVLARLFS